MRVASLSLVLLLASCSAPPSPPQTSSSPAASSTGAASSAPSAQPSGTPPGRIPQPDVQGLDLAPESARVDLAMPIFSDPTNITNPLFPISDQASVLMLGTVEDLPFRSEVTLLPQTRIFEWSGQNVEARVSQYLAFLDGRIEEVAYDHYAQADDGSVWYFGEDVFNFAEGAIANTEGSWLAGRDGPAAMIMPSNPRVGDVYRPENIPGLVFEEVTVKEVDGTVEGPLGSVDGAMMVEELHADGGNETKTFAPGYGEFFTAAGGEVEALALAVPTDASSEPMPRSLQALGDRATDAYEAARTGDWQRTADSTAAARGSWNAYRAAPVPTRIANRVRTSLRQLTHAVRTRQSDAAAQAALNVLQSVLDLQLRYRDPQAVELDRIVLWTRQLELNSAAARDADVSGDAFTLDYLRDRLPADFGGELSERLTEQFVEIQVAGSEGELRAAAEAARDLRTTLARLGA